MVRRPLLLRSSYGIIAQLWRFRMNGVYSFWLSLGLPGSRIRAVRLRFGGVVQAILRRTLPDDETGGAPAFETHGPAAVGPPGVPGDVIVVAFSADDGVDRLHSSGFTLAFTGSPFWVHISF